MPNARVMAVFQNVSNLPEDRYVNTFHFGDNQPGAITEALRTEIINAVQEFYITPPPGGYPGLSAYLSSRISRDALAAELRIYDLADSEPREPFIHEFTPLAAGSGSNLPAEVALCVSYYSDKNSPTRRGRIYFGPLNQSAENAGVGAENVPGTSFREALAVAAARLRDRPDTLQWSVYGKFLTGKTMKPITAGWVDNGWDTQRRRGKAASQRTTW